MSSDFNALERMKQESVMRLLADMIKIDISLMNKKDYENMSMHIENILKRKDSNDLHDSVIRYVRKEKNAINKTFSELKEVEVLKKEKKSAISKAESQQIENIMNSFLEIRPEQLRKEGRTRKKYLDEMWRKLWITNMVIRDFHEVCHYLESNINQPESFTSIAKRMDEKQYRVYRKLYRFDICLEHDTLNVRNFSIEDEAVREHARSL